VKYTEQKYIQNHPLKIRVRKIRGGGNYSSKYGTLAKAAIINWINWLTPEG